MSRHTPWPLLLEQPAEETGHANPETPVAHYLVLSLCFQAKESALAPEPYSMVLTPQIRKIPMSNHTPWPVLHLCRGTGRATPRTPIAPSVCRARDEMNKGGRPGQGSGRCSRKSLTTSGRKALVNSLHVMLQGGAQRGGRVPTNERGGL